MTQRRIDAYFLRSSSSSSTASTVSVIEIDSEAPTDDEQPPAAASPHRGSAKKRRGSSTAASRRTPRKRRAASTGTTTSSQQSIDSYFISAERSSSAPMVIDVTGVDGDNDWDVWLSEDDTMLLSQLAARRTERAAARHAVPHRAQSVVAPQPDSVVPHSQRVVRRVLSDVANVRHRGDRSAESKRQYRKVKSFYEQVRDRFGHPADRSMCAYCGEWEHTALHHEKGFERAGAVSSKQYQHSICITDCVCELIHSSCQLLSRAVSLCRSMYLA
jgi:hypothetical protein